MKKRIIAIALALLLALSLFACTTKQDNKPEETKTVTLPGTWEMTEAKAEGVSYTAKEIEMEWTLVLNDDGTAVLIEDGDETDGIEWTQSGSTIKTSFYGIDLFDFTFDGKTLSLHDADEGVDFVFQKKSDKQMKTEANPTEAPTPEPTEEPTPEPTEEPTPEPTEEPTPEPTAEPAPSGELDVATLVDTWTITKVTGMGMTFSAAEMELDGIFFTFYADGTADFVVDDEATSGTYEISGYNIVFNETEGDEVTVVYDPETDTFTMSDDEGFAFVFERTSAAGSNPAATAAPVSGDAADIPGTWNLTQAVVEGMTIPISMLGYEMAFVLNADGTAAMLYDGETTEGLNWALNGSTITLSVYGMSLYDFEYTGTSLILHETESGVDMVFEK